MSKPLIIRGFRRGKSQTDWTRVDALVDETIDYSDIPPTDEEFWQEAVTHSRSDHAFGATKRRRHTAR